ncbi:MAG TPA: SpoIIE family protein phosphatase [Pseudomonadales bacterium]|jgi:serine phosphatase RsbU (regulator of sigma subunit)
MKSNRQTILLIDDDAVLRQELSAHLSAAGYGVLEAVSGQKGLALFESEQPDLVVCDLHMPGQGGIDVLRVIAASPREVPVIVVSGTDELSDVMEALRIGASDYFIKPIADIVLLEHAVRRCLEQSSLRSENRHYREELEKTNRELGESLQALQMDQQAGRHVQMRMLPVTPRRICGFRCTHRILPSLYLSGDFIDYFKVGRSSLAFFMADISGHGASSAFLTVALKNLTARLRSQYMHEKDQTILDPAAVLAKANEELLALGIGKHATIFAGCIDSPSGKLTYSVGAQFPMPVLVSSDGAHYLEGQGKPIGLFADAQYVNCEMQLPESFALFLCSDGVLEMLPGKKLSQREAALLDILSRSRGTATDAVTALGLKQVADSLPDDVAIVSIARKWNRAVR